jgi:hypothetical protein
MHIRSCDHWREDPSMPTRRVFRARILEQEVEVYSLDEETE